MKQNETKSIQLELFEGVEWQPKPKKKKKAGSK